MSDSPEIAIQRQTAFCDDGELEVIETEVETSLEDFGAEVDHRERTVRIDQPEAGQFGVDDRPDVEEESAGDQATLFADTEEDQQTLSGEEAATRCLFRE